ncbi:MAG: hypothetical protein VCD66_03450 [Alphaproteobacteria bacterium]
MADLGSGEDNPCLKIAKGGGKTTSQRTAQLAAEPAVKAVTDAIKAPLDSLTKGLGSLFGKKD